ncbi:MAG: phosphoribosyl-ATP pyrophosphohydrolase/phosphoribosyl-AMP cyclohydrolase [Glaciecola sp.]
MIIPSIDLEKGRTVQLVGGEDRALDAGTPMPILKRFRLAGEVAVVDLDAAKGEGCNAALIRELCAEARVRVGGGIRDLETALAWLNAGAAKIVIGTAANEGWLDQLPRERVIVALDARDGDVVTHGWRQSTGCTVLQRMAELRDSCSGFLVTFVECEGRLGGTRMDLVEALVEAASPAKVTIAGGVTTAAEIAELDRLGADAQVGMALYTGRLSLAQAIVAPLTSDRADGFWPTVVADERGTALGLVYSSARSMEAAVEEQMGVYESRRRGLWVKGESSGCTQELLAVDLDCDRTNLRFTVRQAGSGFCHMETHTCWGEDRGLARLQARLIERLQSGPELSNTVRLAADSELLRSKLIEEAGELAEANSPSAIRHEAADLLYFALVKASTAGIPLSEIETELDRRELFITRRACEAKDSSCPA